MPILRAVTNNAVCVDELIEELQRFRAEHGNLHVLAYFHGSYAADPCVELVRLGRLPDVGSPTIPMCCLTFN